MSNPVDFHTGELSSTEQGNFKNDNLKSVQTQVDEVVGIMRSNVEKIMVREERLSELDSRADQLNASAAEFQTTSRKVRKKYWWKNVKMMLILGGVIVIIIIIIIVSTVGVPSSSEKSSSSNDGADAAGEPA